VLAHSIAQISGARRSGAQSSICFTMAVGALAAWLFERRAPSLAARFTIAAAAGLVAGESLVGVAASFAGMAGR
jgi:uncharacterized oligopeptide transporter (OPT) family protein